MRQAITTAILLLLFASVLPTRAQEATFTVEVETKTSEHPNSDRGDADGYTIDGVQGKELTLVRGKTYTFQMRNVPAIHPFYISTDEIGAGADPYTNGVSGNFATGNQTLTFTPPEDAPDLLYYQCQSHLYMGWRINVMSQPEAALQSVAQGFTAPVALVSPPDDNRLFIVDQIGEIRIVAPDGTLLDEPFLDLRDRIVDLNPGFDERGLLGLAFHPGYATNGRFFVYYSAPVSRAGARADFNHTSHISEFAVSSGDADRANADSERILLQVDEPQGNHNAGTLAFGPDGFLYISLGDGGGADDTGTGHVEDWYEVNEGGNAQNVTANLLGKILRIDVDDGDPYGIPQDNPFVGRDGLDEIYAYGLRNPYRFSFDMGGDRELFVGDAGQNRWEEVSIVTRGGNYGWNVKEGTHCFNTDNPDEDRPDCPDEVGAGHPDAGAPLIDPIIEYANRKQEGGLGEVIIGGAVYRGSMLPEFEGRYLFGDWSEDRENPSGLVFITTSRPESGLWSFEQVHFTNTPDGELARLLLGFGQDNAGEIYLLTNLEPGPTGTTGEIFRLATPSIVDANEPDGELPRRVMLEQNYPNPFNPSTTIEFRLDRPGPVTLKVFDVMGREVARLMDGVVAAGAHSVAWNGTGEDGGRVASGPYFYRLQTEERTETRVMTLLK